MADEPTAMVFAQMVAEWASDAAESGMKAAAQARDGNEFLAYQWARLAGSRYYVMQERLAWLAGVLGKNPPLWHLSDAQENAHVEN